jgi:hypothetical protein
MVLCGEPLDSKSEETYQSLRAALKNFINENAKWDGARIAPDYDQTKTLRAREEIAKGFCKQPTYPAGKAMLQSFLREEATVRKRLEVPSDPTKGDCF